MNLDRVGWEGIAWANDSGTVSCCCEQGNELLATI